MLEIPTENVLVFKSAAGPVPKPREVAQSVPRPPRRSAGRLGRATTMARRPRKHAGARAASQQKHGDGGSVSGHGYGGSGRLLLLGLLLLGLHAGVVLV